MSTGLGLPIVRIILTQQGEDIWVNNEKEGVTFTFSLAKCKKEEIYKILRRKIICF